MNENLTWEQICPLCGNQNNCAIAAHEPPGSCWCTSVTISATALANIPEESAGRRCICANCGVVRKGGSNAG